MPKPCLVDKLNITSPELIKSGGLRQEIDKQPKTFPNFDDYFVHNMEIQLEILWLRPVVVSFNAVKEGDINEFQDYNSPCNWWYGIISSSMEKNYRGQERNGIFDAWILNFDFGRKFLQRLFTFHYATMIISYKDWQNNLAHHIAIMKLGYLRNTLKIWNDTSHDC